MELKNPSVFLLLTANVYIALIYATRRLLFIHQKVEANFGGLAATIFVLNVQLTSVGLLQRLRGNSNTYYMYYIRTMYFIIYKYMCVCVCVCVGRVAQSV